MSLGLPPTVLLVVLFPCPASVHTTVPEYVSSVSIKILAEVVEMLHLYILILRLVELFVELPNIGCFAGIVTFSRVTEHTPLA